MRNHAFVPLLLLASLTGCATSTMRTAERLESGQVAFGGGFDAIPLPTRVHGNFVVGVGDVADLGVIGGAGLPTHVGLSSRLYLGPVDLTMQAEHFWLAAESMSCMAILFIPICGPDFGDVFSLSGRLTSRMRELEDRDQAGLYGGLVFGASAPSPFGPTRRRDRNPFDSGAVGVVGGVETRRANGLNFQTEIIVAPICSGSACRGALQVSFGWNFGAHRPRAPRERYRHPKQPTPTWRPRHLPPPST